MKYFLVDVPENLPPITPMQQRVQEVLDDSRTRDKQLEATRHIMNEELNTLDHTP